MTISETTLDVDVFNEIRTILVATTLAATNTSTGQVTAASVNAVYNDKTLTRPQVVIEPIHIDIDGYKFGSGKHNMINAVISVIHNTTYGIDQIAPVVVNALETTPLSGMDLIGVSSDYAPFEQNETKYHVKTLTFTYDRE